MTDKYPGPNQSEEDDRRDYEEATDAGSPANQPSPDESRQAPEDSEDE